MKIPNKQNLKVKVGLNTLYQVLGRFVTAGTGLVITRLINEYVGRDGFGEFQIVLTYVTIYWMLTDFGLNAVVVREMASNSEDESKYYGGLITLRTLLSVVMAAFSLAILVFMPYSGEVKIAIAVGVITILTQGIKGATHGLFQTKLRYELQFAANFVGAIFYLALIYYFVLQGSSLIWLIYAFVIGQVVMTVISVALSNRILKFRFSFDKTLLKQLAITTIPFGVSLLFNLGNFKLDTLLLSVLSVDGYSNESAVAIYNAGYKFFEFALIVPTFLMNAVYPVMIKKFEASFLQFKKVFIATGGILLGVSTLGFLFTLFAGPWLISLIGDLSEYGQSVQVLIILIGITPIFYISSLLMWTVLTFKKQHVLMKIYAAAFVLNLGLNIWLIPKYAFFGAAITTGLSELLILVLLAGYILPKWLQLARETKAETQ